jgi:hypothetical protein
MAAGVERSQHDDLTGHTVATTLSVSAREFCDELGRRFD